MKRISNWCSGISEGRSPHGGRLWKHKKGRNDEGAQKLPHLHDNREENAGRDSDSIHHDRHEHRDAPRSSRDELIDIKYQLFDWLKAHDVPVDSVETGAMSMLRDVFASYDDLWKYNRRSQDKISRKDTKLRTYEIEKAAADQEILRLGQRLGILDGERREREEQQRVFVDGLVANHNSLVNHQGRDHKSQIAKLTQTHQDTITALNQSHQDKTNELKEQHSLTIQHERRKVTLAEEDMRMSVDNFQALQDDELRNRFYKLKTEVESLARLTPAADILQQAQAVGVNVRLPANGMRRDQKLLLQGVLWAIIVDGVFSTPFRVFGAYGDSLFETWVALFGQNHNGRLEWPEADPLAERWRYTTVDRLRRTSPSNDFPFLTRLAALFSNPTNPTLSTRLHDLVTQSRTFSLLTTLERCRVRVFLPSASILGPNTPRDSEDIKDVYPGNEAEVPLANAEFVVAPGMSKEGNSRGGKLEEKVVLGKAVVYFSLDS